MTNADRIRQMTDEKLAEFLQDLADGCIDICDAMCTEDMVCKDCYVWWLMQDPEHPKSHKDFLNWLKQRREETK